MSRTSNDKWRCSYKLGQYRVNPAKGSHAAIKRSLLLPVTKEAANNLKNEVSLADLDLFDALRTWMDKYVGGGELLDEKWCVLSGIFLTVDLCSLLRTLCSIEDQFFANETFLLGWCTL